MPDAETDYMLANSTPETLAAEVRSDIIQNREKRNTIVRLRRMGLSYEQISDAIEKDDDIDWSASPSSCQRTVAAYLDRMATEDSESIDQLRELENLRLDDMQKSLQEKIMKGSVPAIKAALQIMERRAKLNGLDAPEVKGLVGAFLDVGDVADPAAVEAGTRAFVAAFTNPGLPDVPKPSLETGGRDRTETPAPS